MYRFIAMIALSSAAIAACSSSGSPALTGQPGAGDARDAGPPPAALCDAAGATTCLATQQACALTGGQPTCVPCDVRSYANKAGACAPIEGTRLAHDFGEFTTNPGQEVRGMCRSWTLGNATDLWVQSVELVQNEASHHSNWLFVPDTSFDGPDGAWKCSDRGYDELTAALAGGVLYAQSTQATHEVQRFPDGAAIHLPAHARIISDVHLLNAGSNPITGHASLAVYSLDPSEVKHPLVPFHMTYQALTIPPRSTSRFTGSCTLADAFQSSVGKPFSAALYYALPHTHILGSRFFLRAIGGALDGTSLLDVSGGFGEARGRAYDPPVDLTGTTGLAFGCEFVNPRDQQVGWGFGDQEMCEMLGFVDSSAIFDSSVEAGQSAGTDGAMQLYSGPCSSFVLPR